MSAEATSTAGDSILNINVGILGHVDSGKTSLVRALSTHLSTAALDKHPQSQERGITLDLGFSAFTSDIPAHLSGLGYSKLQYTLVDCPGHASLIRTIIGGAQIIDMMILVIDIVKGIQTQTAECLVIGEITTDNMIVVLNKVDLLPEEGREKEVEKMKARIRKVLASTKFAEAPFVVLAASPGGTGKMGAAAPVEVGPDATKTQSTSVAGLVDVMKQRTQIPTRAADGPFLFAIDHCFAMKGQGTVVTGTVLSGSCKVGEAIEFPELGQEKKVKSIQMFKKPVSRIQEGDRAGICVSGLDAAVVERGVACHPGAVVRMSGAIGLVRKIRFFKGLGESEAKFHVTVGHSTVMATAVFFGAVELAGARGASVAALEAVERDLAAAAIVAESTPAESGACDPLSALPARTSKAAPPLASEGRPVSTAKPAVEMTKIAAEAKSLEACMKRKAAQRGIPPLEFPWGQEFCWQPELLGGKGARPAAGAGASAGTDVVYEWQWAALLFDAPITAPLSSLIIGSHLDGDVHANACRIAFFGRLAEPLPSADIHELRRLQIYKQKVKCGQVDRVEEQDGSSCVLIGRNVFKKETDMSIFVGLKVHTQYGQMGTIDAAFGKGGKFRAVFRSLDSVDLQAAKAAVTEDPRLLEALPGALKKEVEALQPAPTPTMTRCEGLPPLKAGDPLFFRFRKYMYEEKSAAGKSKALVQ